MEKHSNLNTTTIEMSKGFAFMDIFMHSITIFKYDFFKELK